MSAENIALWESVSKTDPKHTKPFTRGGGFRGTATNATYLAMRATETFGPCGIGWGVTVLDERLLDGSDGVKIHRVHVKLWYVLDGKHGEIEHFGQTEFCGRRANGNSYTDEEAPKKSLTDAMTKALSLLGFAADVYLGLYDDNKYVSSLKAEFAETAKLKGEPQGAGTQHAAVTASDPPPPTGNVTPFPGNDALDAMAVENDLKSKIDKAKTINSVTDMMLSTEVQRDINTLPPAKREEVRDYAKARLVALGWPSKRGA